MRSTRIVFGLTAGVVAASTFITFSFGNRVIELDRQEELRQKTISDLDAVMSTVLDAETGQRGFIITGDESYLSPFKQAESRLHQKVEEVYRAETKISSDDLRLLMQLINGKFAELNRTVDMRRTKGFEAATSIVRGGEGKETMDRLRALIGRLRSEQEAMWQLEALSSHETTKARTLLFIVTGIANIACLGWGYWRIRGALRDRAVAIENAQRESDLFSTTLASIGDCVIVTDAAGRITFMNSVAEEVTGWCIAEAKNRPLREIFRIVNEETRKAVDDPVEKVIRDGAVVALANHTILIRKDGSELPIDDSGAPIRDAKGDIEGVVLVFRDFSKHRQAEQALRKAKESAESANQAKDRFLAMVSHELRTPLSPVLTTLYHWETSSDASPEIKADIEMLRRNIELEARIIDDLLDLTRVNRGAIAVFPEPTDVHDLIAALLEILRSDFVSKNLQLVPRLLAQQHFVDADAGRLQQVVSNILRNAVKFTDPGGTITVSTSNDEERHLTISISDTGIGMSREVLATIFTPFEQGGRERSRRSGGLGLGMSIARALVELMEGTVVADSPGVGRGSTITITLPDAKSHAKPVPPHSRLPGVTGRGSILLVEDHADSAAALARVLRARGYEVLTSESVAGALRLFHENNFSLLVCDVGLPDGTGYELVRHVRTSSKIPAIALTGFAMPTDIEKAEQAGFDAHLPKPVNLQKLEATISTLIGGNEMGRNGFQTGSGL